MFIELDKNIINTMFITQVYPYIEDRWGSTEYRVAVSTCNWQSNQRAEYYIKCKDLDEMKRVYNNFKELLGVTEDIKNVRYNTI